MQITYGIPYIFLLTAAGALSGSIAFHAVNRLSNAKWYSPTEFYLRRISIAVPLVGLFTIVIRFFAGYFDPVALWISALCVACWMTLGIAICQFPRSKKLAAVCLVSLALSGIVWSWSAIMSLMPNYHSTIFPWTILCLSILLGACLYAFECRSDESFSSIAKYLLGLSLLWGYLYYSEYLIFWYADLPFEATVFTRIFSTTRNLSVGLGTLVPFLLLINPTLRKNKTVVLSCSFILFTAILSFFYFLIFA